MKELRQPVEIHWVDSHSYEGVWHDPDDLSDQPVACVSWGVIVNESKAAVTIAGHVASDENNDHQCSGEMTIPRSAIVSTKQLSS